MSFLKDALQQGQLRRQDPTAWPFMNLGHRLRVLTVPHGATKTKSDMAAACDINVIMKHYKKTGLVSHFAPGGARYEDLPDQSDYHEAMNLVTQSQQSFEALPATVRDRFANDPARLLQFLSDPANRSEAEKLGLVPKAPPPPEPVKGPPSTKGSPKPPPAKE